MARLNGMTSPIIGPAAPVSADPLYRPVIAPEFTELDPFQATLLSGGAQGEQHSIGNWLAAGYVSQGIKARNFEDECLWHRIWMSLREVDMKILMADSAIQTVLWNAHRRTVTIESKTTEGNAQGTSLATPLLPQTLAIGQEKTFTFNILVRGPMDLNVKYHLEHDGPPQALIISFKGLRAIFFDVYHDWAMPYQITLSMPTSIATTRRLHEQRKPLQNAVRRQIDVDIVTFVGDKASNLLHAVGNRAFVVPIETEPISLTNSGSLLDLTTLNVAENLNDYSHLQRGLYIVARNLATGATVLCEKTTQTANTIVLREGFPSAWNAGDVVIYPTMPCTIKGFDTKAITNRSRMFGLTFNEYIPSGASLPAIPPLTEIAIWDREPNWSAPISIAGMVTMFNLGHTGTVDSLATENSVVPRIINMTFAGNGKAGEKILIDHFIKHRARWAKFRVPTWQDDFIPTRDPQAGSPLFYVKNNYADFALQGHEEIMIILTNGTRLIRKIVNSARVSASEIVLELDLQFASNIAISAISLCCYYLMARLDSDTLMIRYQTDLYYEAKMKFYELVREYE